MKLTKFQRQKIWKLNKEIANGLVQLGNISFAALMFGQAFGGFKFNILLAITGAIIFALLYSSAIILMKRSVNE
ncbi:MAG: hypothetical protein ABFQ62_03535 [Patescibacteria group bacterium]